MSDLIERLRDIDLTDDAVTKLEAADKIERLEAELKEAYTVREQYLEIERLQARVEALESVRDAALDVLRQALENKLLDEN